MCRRNRLIFALFTLILALWGCNYKLDIPTEFPTPPPPTAQSSPLAKLGLKRDADLESQIAKIAELARGKVGVAAVRLDTGDAALLNADERFPMQSVYKLPISMAVLDQVRLEQLDLDEKIGVTKEDFVRQGMRSPLRDQNPNGDEFTIRELIRLSMVESDGTASDVLMRIGGGAPEMQSFLTQIGIRDMKVVNTEKEIGRDWKTQYENYSTPLAAAELLRWLALSASAGGKALSEPPALAGGTNTTGNNVESGLSTLPPAHAGGSDPNATLLKFMADSVPGAKRLKGELPPGTYVAHKTGTGGTQNGITGATNDVGLIRLPNGTLFAIAVFVSDSPADEKTREAVIAKIAKAVWDQWNI